MVENAGFRMRLVVVFLILFGACYATESPPPVLSVMMVLPCVALEPGPDEGGKLYARGDCWLHSRVNVCTHDSEFYAFDADGKRCDEEFQDVLSDGR
jgi:hypothetical protein